MKYVTLILFLILSSCTSNSDCSLKKILVISASTMSTTRHTFNIIHSCDEGCVSCDNRFLIIKDNKTGTVQTIKGSSWHIMSHNKTPLRFLGYQFKSPTNKYRLFDHNNMLEIYDNKGKLLTSEKWNRKN